MTFDIDEAEARWNERMKNLSPEEKELFQTGYISSSADAVSSLDSILDNEAMGDSEKLMVLHSLTDYMRFIIVAAELARGKEFFS